MHNEREPGLVSAAADSGKQYHRPYRLHPDSSRTRASTELRGGLRRANRRYNDTEFNQVVIIINIVTLALMLCAQSYFWFACSPPNAPHTARLPAPHFLLHQPLRRAH